MKKIKNILFILVALLLVVVKVEAADYATPVFGEEIYKKQWDNQYATEKTESFSDAIIVKDGVLSIGYTCDYADGQDEKCHGLIVKYDNDGEVVWIAEHDGENTHFAKAVELEDGYVLFLEYEDSVSDTRDYYLVKYDFEGKKVWEKSIVEGFTNDGVFNLNYYNELIAVTYGDKVLIYNTTGELVKELSESTLMYPVVNMNEKGIYVVGNLVDETAMSADLVLEVYDYDYKLISSSLIYETEFDSANNLVAINAAIDFDIIEDKFVVLTINVLTKADFVNLVLNDKYEVENKIVYDDRYFVYENEASKNGFVTLLDYDHDEPSCNAPSSARESLTGNETGFIDYECGNLYMLVVKYSNSGEKQWEIEMPFYTMGIGSKNAELVVVGDDETDNGDFDAYISKYTGIYNITTKDDGNGTVTVTKVDGNSGDEVEFTVTPKEGYRLLKVTVTTSDGNSVEFTDYKFIMPTDDVVVSVEFEKIPENPNTGLNNPFIILGGILVIALAGSLVVKKKKFI